MRGWDEGTDGFRLGKRRAKEEQKGGKDRRGVGKEGKWRQELDVVQCLSVYFSLVFFFGSGLGFVRWLRTAQHRTRVDTAYEEGESGVK